MRAFAPCAEHCLHRHFNALCFFIDGYVNNYAERPSNTIPKLIKISNPIPFSAIVPDAIPNNNIDKRKNQTSHMRRKDKRIFLSHKLETFRCWIYLNAVRILGRDTGIRFAYVDQIISMRSYRISCVIWLMRTYATGSPYHALRYASEFPEITKSHKCPARATMFKPFENRLTRPLFCPEKKRAARPRAIW